ncbi:tRNA (guanosine(46)-N7)-methyltransferase TrmB [Gleimia hominis]|uniref:tRNA (guanosine(46)-N7)-methyltransferase TrmB n=1 Tax=Gleimia hominis TaxID=595468 RepID=UPI000C80513F
MRRPVSLVNLRGSSVDIKYPARTKSFARRGRPLHDAMERVWAEHAEEYVAHVPRDGGLTTVDPQFQLDPQVLFARVAPLIVEVGTGNGEQLVAYAQAHPDVNCLGLEVWRPGLAKTVARAVRQGVHNLRLVEADAAQALPTLLPEACAREVWTFFPDPWRKARHRKRRLVNEEFAGTVARLLQDSGVWRLATDWPDYAWQMRDVVEASAWFENPYAGERVAEQDPRGAHGGFAPRFADRIRTRFETRGVEAGRVARDVVGVRVER